MSKCNACNKSRSLTLKAWKSTYVRKDGTVVPVIRQLCTACYERQEKLSKTA